MALPHAGKQASVRNPFVENELDGLLWVADFQGSDVVAIDPLQVG